MNESSLTVVVLEGNRDKMLIYRFLRNMGVEGRRMRIMLSPSGAGSAEHWVRRQFVREVKEYRRRNHHARTSLIVIIDADTSTVHDRCAQLDQALRDSEVPIVGPNECIARLVPKRNIETWILCLNERQVNEEKDYKRESNDWNELVRQAAGALCHCVRSPNEPPPDYVESLRTGVRELRRL